MGKEKCKSWIQAVRLWRGHFAQNLTQPSQKTWKLVEKWRSAETPQMSISLNLPNLHCIESPWFINKFLVTVNTTILMILMGMLSPSKLHPNVLFGPIKRLPAIITITPIMITKGFVWSYRTACAQNLHYAHSKFWPILTYFCLKVFRFLRWEIFPSDGKPLGISGINQHC